MEDAKIAARNVYDDLEIEKAKMEAAEAKEEAILMSIGDGLVAVDEKGNIALMNKTAAKLLGWKREEVVGKVFSEILLGIEDKSGAPVSFEKRPMSIALYSGVTTATTAVESNYYYIRRDKTKFPVAITVTPVIFNGKIIGAIEVFRDATQEKEIDRAKTEFVSLASHQLRTPTTSINWYSEMLFHEEVGALNEQQKRYLEEIYRGNRRMIDLVNTLLSVSRIELGTFAVKSEPTNVASVAEDVLEELRTQIDNKGLKVERKYEKDVPVIQSDRKLIRIVLQNLLANAATYTFSNGKISLEMAKAGSGVNVKIADNGCGIPESAKSKICTKFFRADNASAIKSDGTGLGLYIVKSIIEALGGMVGFQSKEGEGSTFSVTIPSRGMVKREREKILSQT